MLNDLQRGQAVADLEMIQRIAMAELDRAHISAMFAGSAAIAGVASKIAASSIG